jgi:hypothetical protein
MRHHGRDGHQRSKPLRLVTPASPQLVTLGANFDQEGYEAIEDDDLIEMNKNYAVVKIGGKTRVMSMEENPVFPDTKVPVFSTVQDFCSFHLKRKKLVGKKRQIGIGKWWIEHSDRRQYDGVVYAPGVFHQTTFNLWRGFACPSVPGDCQLYLAHLRANICSGNMEHFEYLLNWMAYGVQFSGRQGEVAVVLRGKEGVGKGVMAKQYGALFGQHFRHVVQASHLIGHFNAHLQQCSVLFADEAFFAGDRSHESVLKALVTEETLLIEPKGVDPFPVRNCLHIIMASNSDWVIPAGADARRYFVLNVGDARKQDGAYFAAIAQQMHSGGREALLDHLRSRDLSQFNVRLVPQTEALAEQKQRSRRGIDRLIEILAHEGLLPWVSLAHPNVAVTSGEEKGKGFYHAARTRVPDLKYTSQRVIVETLKEDRGARPGRAAINAASNFRCSPASARCSTSATASSAGPPTSPSGSRLKMCGDTALVPAQCAHGAQTTQYQWLVAPNRHGRIRPRCPKPARAKWLFCKGLGGLGAWGACSVDIANIFLKVENALQCDRQHQRRRAAQGAWGLMRGQAQ